MELIFKNRPRRRLGSLEPTRRVNLPSGKTTFIMSEGALEKQEVDYLEQAAVEKDRRQRRRRENNELIGGLLNAARQTPQGQRSKMLDDLLKRRQREV